MEFLVPTAIAAGAAGLLKAAERFGPADFRSDKSLVAELVFGESGRAIGNVLARK